MTVAIERVDQVPTMLAAPLAVVLVSVSWSPWPRWSRSMLAALEDSRAAWWPDGPVAFFDLWPERDKELEQWYDQLCGEYHPPFELHGHGYGPLWWVAGGVVRDCLAKPYEVPLGEIQQRSRSALLISRVDGGRHRVSW